MASERLRLVELALESLQNKKRQIDEEIEALTRELRRGGRTKAPAAGVRAVSTRRSRFSEEERIRRSARMKAYWEKWRKQHRGQK